jgi:hypothetical protein
MGELISPPQTPVKTASPLQTSGLIEGEAQFSNVNSTPITANTSGVQLGKTSP